MKKLNVVLCALFVIVATGSAYGTGFDCRKAKTPVERAICANDELSKLDESLNRAYKKTLKSTFFKRQMILSQRQWLQEVRDKCRDVECIRIQYETRIKELRGLPPCSSPENCDAKGAKLYKSGQFARSIPYFLKQLDLARGEGDKHQILDALNNLAVAHFNSGAKYFARSWIKVAQSISDEDAKTNTNAKLILPHVKSNDKPKIISGVYQRYIGGGRWSVIDLDQTGRDTFEARLYIVRYGLVPTKEHDPAIYQVLKGHGDISGAKLLLVYRSPFDRTCEMTMRADGIDIVLAQSAHKEKCEFVGSNMYSKGRYYLIKKP